MLEVGLGGRLDVVNVIDPDVAVITNIGLDHADWLGDTRDSVAYEKAGIMRDGVPALCGDLDVPGPLLEHAESLKSPLFLRGRDFDLALDPHSWHWRGVGPGASLVGPGSARGLFSSIIDVYVNVNDGGPCACTGLEWHSPL